MFRIFFGEVRNVTNVFHWNSIKCFLEVWFNSDEFRWRTLRMCSDLFRWNL